jgi:dephospho-CoA kinase
MCVIGLTGGIACGKTTVSELLQRNGFKIIDCDEISHQIMDHNPDLIKDISKHFPSAVTNGKVDRTILGKLVFADSKQRRLLNRLTHSRIFKEILWRIFNLRVLQMQSLVVLDAPLLFETKILEYLTSPVIVVSAGHLQK